MRDKGRRLTATRIVLLAGSAAAIIYGIATGEPLAVLAKGVKVCLECIGLG